jgi:hypothetical protein
MSEKKWFIYVGDHHEGPFSVEEIWAGIESARFQKAAFVWADGMKDWVALSTVPDFDKPVVPEPPAMAPPTSSPAAPVAVESSEPQLSSNWNVATENAAPSPVLEDRAPTPVLEEREPTMTGVTATTVVEVGEIEDRSHSGVIRPTALGGASTTRPSTAPAEKHEPFISAKMKPFLFATLIIAALAGMQKLGFLKGVESKIASMLSSLPELPDVAPEEYNDLKKVVKAPLSNGPLVSVALSKADPLSPIFYVATNLPEGAKFEIYVEGISHRILNTLSFSGKLDVATAKNIGRSQALRYPDGKPIPRGEYYIYVMEAPVGQPDIVYKELLQLAPVARNLPGHLPQERRLVFSKKIFFGAKDTTYEQRLKEFHDKLVTQAQAEVLELAQTVATLESQALVSFSTYDRLKKQPIGPRQKQVWNATNRTWRPVEAQVVQKYAGLSADQIRDNYFHWNLVQEFLAVEKILSDAHSAQEKLFTTSATASSLETEVNWLRSQFETRKGLWKAAIEKSKANPADPETGLPVKVTIETPAVSENPAGKEN